MPLARPGSIARFYQDVGRLGRRAAAVGVAGAAAAAPYLYRLGSRLFWRTDEHAPAIADYQLERVGALPKYHTDTTYRAASRVQSLAAPSAVAGPVSGGFNRVGMYAAAYRPRHFRKHGKSRSRRSGVYTGPRRSLGIKGMMTGGLLGLQLIS